MEWVQNNWSEIVGWAVAIFGIVSSVRAIGVRNFIIRAIDAMETTEGKEFAERAKNSIKNKAVEAGINDSLKKLVKKVRSG